MPKLPHWGWHSVRFQSQVFKACVYRCEIQEMLHPRNWCLCRWNSSIVTIWVKWQQCSPDHCLRDDILLSSISFLIIFSCSIHHLSLFSLWCTPLLFSLSLYPKYLHRLASLSYFFPPSHPTCDSIACDYLCLCATCCLYRLQQRRHPLTCWVQLMLDVTFKLYQTSLLYLYTLCEYVAITSWGMIGWFGSKLKKMLKKKKVCVWIRRRGKREAGKWQLCVVNSSAKHLCVISRLQITGNANSWQDHSNADGTALLLRWIIRNRFIHEWICNLVQSPIVLDTVDVSN